MKRIVPFLLLALGACGPKANAQPAASERVAEVKEPAGKKTTAKKKKPPRAKPAPAPASAPAPAASKHPILDAHNAYRAQHCAAPLTWSDKLAKIAQKWADSLVKQGCAFEHSRTDYGENLAAGTSGAMSPEDVVAMWYREVKDYNFKKGGFSMETGHFTQLVWLGTKSVGCGMSSCNGLDIWVCNYDPAGNWERQYKQNVKPTSCE